MRAYGLNVLPLVFLTGVAFAGEVRPLIRAGDYPPEAVLHHWQGDVAVKLTISPEGRVTECKIAKSSGHQVLDDTTCRIIIDRARFKPAVDKTGKAIETQVTLPPITWSLH